jgi:hypothetical protein
MKLVALLGILAVLCGGVTAQVLGPGGMVAIGPRGATIVRAGTPTLTGQATRVSGPMAFGDAMSRSLPFGPAVVRSLPINSGFGGSPLFGPGITGPIPFGPGIGPIPFAPVPSIFPELSTYLGLGTYY